MGIRRKVIAGATALLLSSAALAAAHPGVEHAVEALSSKLDAAPTDVDLLLLRSELQRREGRFALAMADIDRAAKLAPKDARLDLWRGLTYFEMAELARADKHLSHYLAHNTGQPMVLWTRARVREARGRYKAALLDYDAALAGGEHAVELFVSRGALLERLGREQEAEANYRLGLQRASGAVVLAIMLIDLEMRRGRFDSAIGAIDQAMGQARVKTNWYLRRAAAQEAAGRAVLARADRERALGEADRLITIRRSSLALFGRAQALEALGRYDEAIVDLGEAIARTPKNHQAHQLLAAIARKRSAQ
ncbi:MAG: tetratricopeptide repeat protein [Bradymonadaceae bacterium]|nr:tetratricopeptide repeat protein [Lujinxingiaceae bacterium]